MLCHALDGLVHHALGVHAQDVAKPLESARADKTDDVDGPGELARLLSYRLPGDAGHHAAVGPI